MSMQLTTTLNQAADIRPLSDTEIDNVDGGFLPILVAALWALDGFVIGYTIGTWNG